MLLTCYQIQVSSSESNWLQIPVGWECLRDPWPRRSFLRRKHNSKSISECAVRGNARSDRGDAKAGFTSRCQHILERPIPRANRLNAHHCRRTQGRRYRTRRRAACECSPWTHGYGRHDLPPRPFDRTPRGSLLEFGTSRQAWKLKGLVRQPAYFF